MFYMVCILPVDRLHDIMPENPATVLHNKLQALNNGRGREGISHHSQFPINTSGWLPVKVVQRAWIQRCYWIQALCTARYWQQIYFECFTFYSHKIAVSFLFSLSVDNQ